MNTHHTPAQEATADFVPVVTSLLGTDLYKFTMLQPMLHSMPANQAEYRFVCRNEAAYPLSEIRDEVERQIEHLCTLRFSEEELQYLGGLRYMKSDFIDFLRIFRLQQRYISVSANADGLSIVAKGPQIHVMLVEIFVLAIVNEIHFRRLATPQALEEGRRRLQDKIALLRIGARDLQRQHPFEFFDFGVRRRFSAAWQEEVVATLAREVPEFFKGTSNVHMAKKYGLVPIGTMAHEYLQTFQATGVQLKGFQKAALENWVQEYRLRKLINILAGQHGQIFLTTHSPVAISCAEDAHLWYLDSLGSIGALPQDKIGPQQKRDPETFLARVAVIAEGPTEVGFLQYLLEKAFGGNPLDHGVRVCDGQGNGATLDLLETLASSGLLFAGLADDEGTAPERWKSLKEKLKGRLHQWPKGCTEDHVIGAVREANLLELLKDAEGQLDGYRLRTLAERLGLQEKSTEAIDAALKASGKTWRALIIAAASGSKEGAPAGQEKAWKKHSQQWFKSTVGGQELAQKMVALGAWAEIQPQLLPLINAVLEAVGRQALPKLDL